MYRRNRQSGIFKQYMVCIISLIVCPFVVLDLIFLVNGLRQVESAYTTAQEFALGQAADSVDDDLKTFQNMVAQISADSDITPYLLRPGSYDSVLAKKKLQIYQAQLNLFDTLYLHISGGENLYSGNGILSLSNFMRNVFVLEEPEGEETFEAYINRAEAFALSLEGNGGILQKRKEWGRRYITVTYPWLNSLNHSLGAAIGVVEETYFLEKLSVAREGYRQGVYLLGKDGSLYFKREQGMELPEEEIGGLWYFCRDKGVYSHRIRGMNCFILVDKSSVAGWNYVAVIPRGQFIWNYVYSQNRVVALITLLLIFCMVLGAIAAVRMYRPVQELWSLLEPADKRNGFKTREEDDRIEAVDEWKSLRTSIAGIMEKNRNIMKELDSNRLLRRQSLLRGLLLGTVDLEEVGQQLGQAGLIMEEDFFCAMVLYSLSPVVSRQQEAVEGAIRSMEIPGLYLVPMDNSKSLALLWNTKGWSEDEDLLVEELYQKISGGEEERWILGISGCYPSMAGISRAYMEALAIGEGMQLKDEAGIFYYENFKESREHNELYIIEEEVKLRQSLLADNGATALKALEALESALEKHWGYENSGSRKFVLFHIIQSLVPIGEKVNIPYLNEKVEEWSHYRNLGDFLLNMRKFCQEILDIRQQAKDQQVNGLYQEILAYLEEYYDDSSISLGEMAERFGMSASYLSRFFRKYSGKNFLEYVTEKRIDRACWLLKNTDLKVKTIVEQVGYLDVASFTKKFRTICGVSPAKYREQVRQESKEENL